MRIIGIKIHNNNERSVIRNLKQNHWYPFGDYHEPTKANGYAWNQNAHEDEMLSELYKSSVADEAERIPDGIKLSVHCIVGKNGSGKTSLLEVMFRILNNFAYKVLEKCWVEGNLNDNPQKGRQLQLAKGLNATLYFETDGNLGIIQNKQEEVYFEYKSQNPEVAVSKTSLNKYVNKNRLKMLLGPFFYTIVTNYSIYSFNEEDYNGGSLKHPERNMLYNGRWVRGLFHKNDGYLAPMVIVPFRNEDGTIDISNEKKLANMRLATLAILFYSQGKSFLDRYDAAYLHYQIDSNSGNTFKKKFDDLCEERIPLSDKETLHKKFETEWQNYLNTNEPEFNNLYPYVQGCVLNYLCYKTLRICLNYRSYGKLLGIVSVPNEDKENIIVEWNLRHPLVPFNERQFENKLKACPTDECYQEIVEKIANPKEENHITLKIKQMLLYLRTQHYQVHNEVGETMSLKAPFSKSVADLIKDYFAIVNEGKDDKHKKTAFHNYDDVFVVLPPAIFDWELYFVDKGTKVSEDLDNGHRLDQLSSGEKQQLQSASYLLYHISNISSIVEDDFRVQYKHINFVMDEAELYYHPDYQRRLIKSIVQILSWSHLNAEKIHSINIQLVTHSPFVLSDIPTSRTLYLASNEQMEGKEMGETFAANVHELLYNQFFIDDTMGEVSRNAIREIIDKYRTRLSMSAKAKKLLRARLPYYKYVQSIVSEPYLKNTLGDMLTELGRIAGVELRTEAELMEKKKVLEAQMQQLETQIQNLKPHEKD